MRRWGIVCGMALAAAAFAAPAIAAPVTLPQVKNAVGAPVPSQAVVCVDPTGVYTGCGGGTVTDPNSAPLIFTPAGGAAGATSSSAGSFTFASADVAKARGWFANCPSNTMVTVTLTDAAGGTRPRTLFDGPQGDRERIAAFASNTGCTIGLEF